MDREEGREREVGMDRMVGGTDGRSGRETPKTLGRLKIQKLLRLIRSLINYAQGLRLSKAGQYMLTRLLGDA